MVYNQNADFYSRRKNIKKKKQKNRIYRLIETVRHSLDEAQGQTASGRSPLGWKTLKNWSQEDNDQGLAPSPINSSLNDDNVMSLWSLVAKSPQCRSRDLTIVTVAVSTKIKNLVIKYFMIAFERECNTIYTDLDWHAQRASISNT